MWQMTWDCYIYSYTVGTWVLGYTVHSLWYFLTVHTSWVCVTILRIVSLHVLRYQETVFVPSLAASSLYYWSVSRMIVGQSEMVREPVAAEQKQGWGWRERQRSSRLSVWSIRVWSVRRPWRELILHFTHIINYCKAGLHFYCWYPNLKLHPK